MKRQNSTGVDIKSSGEIKKYLVKLSNQILVQENDFVMSIA